MLRTAGLARYLPIIESLGNPALEDRHWGQIGDVIGQKIAVLNSSLLALVALAPAAQCNFDIVEGDRVCIGQFWCQNNVQPRAMYENNGKRVLTVAQPVFQASF